MTTWAGNDPCPCGSGKKYKKCCLNQATAASLAAEPEPEYSTFLQKDQLSASAMPALDAIFERAFAETKSGGDPNAAMGHFKEAWTDIRTNLTPAMTSLQDIGPAYDGVFYPEDAVSEYLMAVTNASLDQPGCAAEGVEFCEFLMRQFTAEEELFQENTKATLGDLHFRSGDPERGTQILRELIRERPQRAVGYSHLAGALNNDRYAWHPGQPLDRPGAIAVLKEALALPVEDAADYDLVLQLEWAEES